MAYDFTLKDLDGNTLTTFDETADPPILIGGFRARVRPDTSCELLTFRVRRDRIPDLAPLVAVFLDYGGNGIFAGPVVTLPPDGSTGGSDVLEVVEVAGGEEYFRTATVGLTLSVGGELQATAQRIIDEGDGIPAVVNTSLAPDADTRVPIYYKPYGVMLDALKELAGMASSATYTFGVGGGSTMRAFFKEFDSTPTSIAWTEPTLEVDRLPLSARPITTKVHLVVSGQRAGEEPEKITGGQVDTSGSGFAQYLTYIAQPVVHTVEDADHADYEAVRTFGLPAGVNPFLKEGDIDWAEISETLDNWTAASDEHRDDDSSTSSSPAATAAQASISYGVSSGSDYYGLVVGFAIMYDAIYDAAATPRPNTAFPGDVTLSHTGAPLASTDNQFIFRAYYGLGEAPEPTPVDAVFYRDARHAAINQPTPGTGSDGASTSLNVTITSDAVAATTDFHVYKFIPLILDTDLLTKIAQGKIHKPGAEIPSRLTLGVYVAPVHFITITGYPGGDATFEATAFEYVLDPRVGFQTIITLNTEELSEVAVTEVLDAHANRREYGLVMGERQ